MPPPGTVTSRPTRANASVVNEIVQGEAASRSPSEVASELRQLAATLQMSSRDLPASLEQAKRFLDDSQAILDSVPNGAARAEVAAALRELDLATAEASREGAMVQVFERTSTRRRRLADMARRHVRTGAILMARTGRASSFARAVVGDRSARHFRSLGQLSESDLRRELTQAGVRSPEVQDEAIAEVRATIAESYQQAIKDRAHRAIERQIDRMNALVRGMEQTPMSDDSHRLIGVIIGQGGQGGQGEMLRQFELMGIHVEPLRRLVDQAHQGYARDAIDGLKLRLPGLLREVIEQLEDTADTVAGWDRSDLEDAIASEAFPEIDSDMRARWAMNGIVGQAVTEHISDARERGKFWDDVYKYALIGAAIIVGAASGGALVSVLAAGAGAAAREGREIYGAWEQQELSAAAAMAGVGSMETAEADLRSAQIATMAGVAAVVVDTVFAGLLSKGHHELVDRLKEAAAEGGEEAMKSVLRRFVRENPEALSPLKLGSDVAAAVAEFAGALGIDLAKHEVEHALEEHH